MRCGSMGPFGVTCQLEKHDGQCAAIVGGVVRVWELPAESRAPDPQSSHHVGVYWNRQKGKWQAQIKRAGHNRHLGRYDTEAEAVAARRAAEGLTAEIMAEGQRRAG